MTFDILFEFERQLSQYTGAPYVIVTDGCTHAVELCMRYKNIRHTEFTAFTYLSIPQTMARLGINYSLTDEQWVGEYRFHSTNIWDSARRLEKNMYRPGMMQCLSFGNGKPIHLGKVGAVLTDDPDAYRRLSMMRSDGRDLRIHPWQKQQEFDIGYHYCPTLEDCAKGIAKLAEFTGACQSSTYPDTRKISISKDFT